MPRSPFASQTVDPIDFDDSVQAGGDDDFDTLPAAGDSLAPGESVQRSSSHIPDETSSTAAAPQRRTKRPKTTALDEQTELQNSQLQEWSRDYAENMAEGTRHKQQAKFAGQSKKSAYFYVLGTGLNGVGAELPRGLQHPLRSMFAGDGLLTAVTGVEFSPAGRKRSYTSQEVETSEEDSRRVRVREEEEDHIARGGDHLDFEDGVYAMGGDEDMEIGRDAPTPLEDVSSHMPWNISSSKHGSRPVSARLALSSAPGGFPSSAGAPSSFAGGIGIELGPPPVRPGSRLTSASPLVGRGAPLPELDDDEEFELYGPAAAVNTQTAQESQWVRVTLDQESSNFLEFLAAETETVQNVTFEQLLPPEDHTKIVAAQGFLHILALATKGLIKVEQSEGYGDIRVAMAG